MSEQRLKDFASEAEHLVPAPELDELVVRGRDLRRLRLTVVAAAVLVAVAGGVLASVDRNDQTGPPTGGPDGGQQQAGSELHYPEELVAGEQRWYLPSVYSPERVWFRVPAKGWDWWVPRAVQDLPLERHLRFTILPLERVAQRPCGDVEDDDSWTPAGDIPMSAARRIDRIPGIRVVEGPESTESFGVPAVHLRAELRSSELPTKCQHPNLFSGQGNWVDGDVPGDYEFWITRLSQGELLLIAADHHPDVNPSDLQELQAMVDSVGIDDAED